MSEKKTRGLGSLISNTTAVASVGKEAEPAKDAGQLMELPINDIMPNVRQPRSVFDKEALEELASSIRQHGLLQPVIVKPNGDNYELIAGERRWRASKMAGLSSIKAVCIPADGVQSLILSIIENLQREDLDPIEEATAYRTLITELKLTQEQVAERVGKERSTISNALRLLDLPIAIQAKLQSGSLTPGHARVLLAVSDPSLQRTLSEKAADKGMSVRELERQVYGNEPLAAGATWGGRSGLPAEALKPAHIKELESQIAAKLGTKVRITEGRRGGKVVISFANDKQFLGILEALGINT
jgi:ParB family chromosome partitioning protein